MTLFNLNIDLVNDNVYTKFGLILSIIQYQFDVDLVNEDVYTKFGLIHSQDTEQKPNSEVNQGP